MLGNIIFLTNADAENISKIAQVALVGRLLCQEFANIGFNLNQGA